MHCIIIKVCTVTFTGMARKEYIILVVVFSQILNITGKAVNKACLYQYTVCYYRLK